MTYLLAILSILLPFLPLHSAEENHTPHVFVSIAPYQFFINQIAGDTIHLSLMVPPNTSFHDYEPRPKQILELAQADLWFRIGESFENQALAVLQQHHPRLTIIDLRDGVDLITFQTPCATACSHCLKTGADLHIWLSPRQAAIQSKKIAQALIARYPAHREHYQRQLDKLLLALEQLDGEIATLLKPLKNRIIMVGHPAYAYFARDYHLEQFPIEYEGKDPSPKQMHATLMRAKQLGIKTIFVQSQYDTRGAALMAKELGAQVKVLEPYSADYFMSMRKIAETIASDNQ